MRTRFFFLFLILGSCAGAQEGGFYPVLAVKLSPLSAIDPLTSTFTIGATFRPAPRLALHFDYGWQYEKLKFIDRTSELANSRYYELRPEIQWFIVHGEKEEMYLALEGFYIPHTFSRNDSYFITKNGRDFLFDSADGTRFTHGLVLKGGMQILFNEYFLMDIFGGFGYRRREINIFNLVNPREGRIEEHSFTVDAFTRPGVKERLHLTLGVRIGGILARRKLRN